MGTTAPLHITLDHARDAISQIVDQFGEDHIYEKPLIHGSVGGCWNVWDGEGSCLVGRALLLIGVPLTWFTSEGYVNGASSETRCEANIRYLSEIASMAGSWTIDDAAIDYFAYCQSLQDRGETWGKARDYAEQHLPSPAPSV